MITGAQSVPSSCGDSTRRWGVQAGAGNLTGQAAAVQASRTDEADIKIVTTEGDTVTLSLQSETDLTLATYSGLVRGKDGSARVQLDLASVTTGNQVGIEVEGDLNREERADISRLIGSIARALRSFFSGHIRAAIHQIASLRSLGSVASFDLQASRTEEVSVAWWKKLLT